MTATNKVPYQNHPVRSPRPWLKVALAILILFICFWAWVRIPPEVSPIAVVEQMVRMAVMPVLAHLYQEDSQNTRKIVKSYLVGEQSYQDNSSEDNWKQVEFQLSYIGVEETPSQKSSPYIPFVYEDANAAHITELRNNHNLAKIIDGITDEYQAMLQVAAWVGTRWDHGVDKVPFGPKACSPSAIVQAGERGAKFWCEIAAKLMVHTATALGWQARLVTLSRNGYVWEHAVAELWSNQYNKWFAVDTDFNVVYEHSGIPLSAFELCHYGEDLRNQNKLTVKSIAPSKKSLPLIDLLPFYEYVHIDLRNDWCSRLLRLGSPAGGDLSTWWTSRPRLKNILTSKIKLDDQSLFDWKVNNVAIRPRLVSRVGNDRAMVEIGLTTYSPTFRGFEVSQDGSAWICLIGSRYSFSVLEGTHSIKARVLTAWGNKGPISEISFRFEGDKPSHNHELILSCVGPDNWPKMPGVALARLDRFYCSGS